MTQTLDPVLDKPGLFVPMDQTMVGALLMMYALMHSLGLQTGFSDKGRG